MSNTNENKKEKSKEALNSFWQKAQSMGKQAAESAKNLAEQTQQYIHDQQAKKYDSVTLEEYKRKSMRCKDANSIKYEILEIKGSSTATMSKKIACAIDKVLDIKGKLSMESQTMREHSNVLVFEVEF